MASLNKTLTYVLLGTALSGLSYGVEPEPVRDSLAKEIQAEAGAQSQDLDRDTDPQGNRLFDASFRDHFFKNYVMMLQGIQAQDSVTFNRPRTWDLTEDPELHLFYEHSEALLPDRSAMTVLVNGKAIYSVFLDLHADKSSTADARGEVVARIPRELLKDYNEVSLLVTQHYTRDCEDPFDYSLWTRVDNESFIRFHYKRKPIESDLANYPLPLYDELGIGALHLTLVGPEDYPASSLEALAPLSLSMGRYADYRGVSIVDTTTDVRRAKTHALLIGTPQENPQIRELLGDVPASAEGTVALVPNPADPTLAVLVVTGGSPAAVMNASWAVSGRARQELLAGASSTIHSVEPSTPLSKRAPRSAPPDRTFDLGDLGIESQTVRGFYAPPIDIPIWLEGDAQIPPNSASATVRYSYGAQLDNRLSTVEVQLDGVVLQSARLDEPEGEESAELTVQLPDSILTPKSTLRVVFHLFPQEFDACERVSDRIIWGTVHETTEFTIHRDHYAQMPDLGRLRYSMWPFTMEPEKGPVTVIVSDRPTLDEAAAAFHMGTVLGRTREERDPAFRIVSASRLDSVPNQHLILLVDDRSHEVYKTLLGSKALAVDPGQPAGKGRTLTAPGDQVLLHADVADGYGIIEEIQHPADPAHWSVLVLRSPTGDDLAELVDTVGDPAWQTKLKHNVAKRTGETIETMKVHDTRRVGVKPLHRHIQAFLREYWVPLVMAIILVAVLFALVISLWSRRRGART